MKGVEAAKGKLVVVVLAVNRLVRKIGECVVHPPHIPFHAETEPAQMGRLRDHWPSCGLFGNRLDIRMFFVYLLVETAKEVDRVQVFATAILVGDPLPLLARIIEIKHGSDRVYAQAIDVILVEQIGRASCRETADFIASVIENVRLPVGMKALAGVGMFEQVCTVEVGQTVSVGREV